MKKMNFYFNFGRCCNLLLPVLMFLTGTFAFAGNGTTPSNNAPTEKVSKKATAVAGNLAVIFNPQNGGQDGNGTVRSMCGMKTGSFSWQIISATAPNPSIFNSPFFLRVEAFDVNGLSAGYVVSRQFLNSLDLNTFGFGGVMPNLGPGFYTARVTAEYPLGNALEDVDFPNGGAFNGFSTSLTIRPSNDAAAPVVTAPTNLTVEGCPGVPPTSIPTTLANAQSQYKNVIASYGITASDCFIYQYAVAVNPVLTSDGCYPVTVTITDRGGLATSRTICVRVLDRTNPTFATCWNSATPANGGSGPFQIGAAPCGGTIPFAVPALGPADNCAGVPTVSYTVNGSPATVGVTPLTPGTYTVVATATDASGNRATCTYLSQVTATPGAPIVCVGQLNLGLNSDCQSVLAVDQFLAQTVPAACLANVTVAVKRGGVWTAEGATATFSIADLGRTLEYRLTSPGDATTSAQSCWGFVTVEDKTGPRITCPPTITLQCNDANAAALLPTTTTGTATGTPFVTDCSAFTTSYSDAVGQITCVASGARTVTRTWVAKDAFGNVSGTCTQTIIVERNLSLISAISGHVPADILTASCLVAPNVGMAGNLATAPIVFGCTTATADLAAAAAKGPYVYLGTTQFYLQANGICGITATYVDSRVDVCAGSYKVTRTWTVMDMCGQLFPAGQMSCNFQQFFLVESNAPTVAASYTNYTLVGVTPAMATCRGAQTVASVRATPVTGALAADFRRVPAGLPYSTVITPRGISDMCDAVNVDMTITPTLSCGGVLAAFSPVSVSNSDLTVTANANGTFTIRGMLMNANMADFVTANNAAGNAFSTFGGSFVISVADNCGKVNRYTILVNFIDNVSPVAVCDGVTATLNTNKQAVLRAASFNNNSTDNCGIDRIFIRRDESTIWCDTIKYECTTPATKVWIRYIDFSGNFTDCCVPISIVDKTPVACVSPANVDVLCNDAALNNLTGLFTVPSTSYDGCGRVDTVIRNTASPISCGNGLLTRTWVFSVTNAAGTFSATCSQAITIKPVRGFRVTPIAPRNLVCSGNVPTLDADKATVIASLRLLHDDTYTPTSSAAAFTTCSAPVVEAEEWTYSNTEFCKVIVRTFTVKDVCDFSSNVDNNSYGTVRGGQLQSEVVSSTTPWAHLVRFTTYTYIKDNTAPIGTNTPVAPICVTGTVCTFGFSTQLQGTDGCTGGTSTGATTGSSLNFSWRIVDAAGIAVGAPGTGTTVSATGLAFGTYTIYYRVADLCGNLSTEYSFTVTGSDCKAPEILVHNKIVALGGQVGTVPTGMARLFYADIRNRITDNCAGDLTNSNKIVLERGGVTTATTPASTVSNAGNGATDGVMFTCADANTTQSVRVWAVDGSNNWNYAVSTITVQDNDGICVARPVIAGTIGTEAGAPVKDVVVSANANGIVAGSATSSATGIFSVTGLTTGTNYQVRAAKTLDNDKKNGVTTLDIALISKHLLGETELNSAYKIIAADVDKNGEVDATDMLHIRRFILSITSNLPAGSAWRFVAKDYAFRNATNPLGEDFPEVVSLANVPVGTNAANFTAVKLGDVNNSFDATTVRGSRVLAFNAEDMNVVAGNEYTVAISSEKMTAAAFQGTFSFDGAKVKAVKAGSLNNVSDNNFNMTANAVAASWNGKSEASATVANITFVATKSGKLSEMLTVNSALAMAEGYDAAGNAMNVTLKFSNGKVAGGEFALYQNTPNPVASSTKIGFNLPKDGQAKLTIYTAEGKVLSVTNNNYKAGYNEVTVNKSDLNASGMLYYRLDTQDNSSTRKMIVIE